MPTSVHRNARKGVGMFEDSACAQQPIVSSVSFVGSCLLLALLATHGVKETAGDVEAVPEVAVVEIARVNDEIRADICFLPQEHMVARVEEQLVDASFRRIMKNMSKSASSPVTLPTGFVDSDRCAQVRRWHGCAFIPRVELRMGTSQTAT